MVKKKDLILIAAALVLALGLYVVSQISFGGEASQVVVTIDGEEVLRKDIALSGRYVLEQDDGARNVICVDNGAVYMEEANCRDHLCINQGKMRSAAKTIVCLPHRLVVRLEGGATDPVEDDLDMIIQ